MTTQVHTWIRRIISSGRLALQGTKSVDRVEATLPRRSFLQTAGSAAVALAAGILALPEKAFAVLYNPYKCCNLYKPRSGQCNECSSRASWYCCNRPGMPLDGGPPDNLNYVCFECYNISNQTDCTTHLGNIVCSYATQGGCCYNCGS